MPAARIFLQLIADFVVYLGLLIRPRKAIAAENLFLRRQLALYQERSTYYNRGRPHMALGPGVPDPPRGVPAPLRPHRHPLIASRAVVAKPVLNGLHHDYRLARCST
jgi:hypothetical protein